MASKQKTLDLDQLVPGKTYLGKRYYNAKRIVWEPIRITSIVPNTGSASGSYKIRGDWLIDGLSTSYVWRWSFAEFDPKWVENKVKELEKERDALGLNISNLKKVLDFP